MTFTLLITNIGIPFGGVEIGSVATELLVPRFCGAPMGMASSLQHYRDGESTSVLIAAADYTHLHRHRLVRESGSRHSAREVVDLEFPCPDFRSENPLRGGYLVP